MIPHLQDDLTWTGTSASARWIVDRINREDGGHYAEGEILNQGFDPFRLYIDTLSNHVTLHVGDTLVKEEGKWKVQEAG